jgi:hypothetical protein
MGCDEREKLLNSVREAENEFRKFSLAPVIKPLGTEIPAGNFIGSRDSDWRKKRWVAKENLEKAKAIYNNHLVSCHKCSIKSHQGKT